MAVKNGGTIIEAVSTQVWPGEAVVRVCIVNWIKGTASGQKKLFTQIGDSKSDEWKREELETIGPALASKTTVTEARNLASNQEPKRVYVGQYPFNEGFLLAPEEAAALLKAHPSHREVIFPYMIGRDLVEGSRPTRWIIDFAQRDMTDAMHYAAAFDIVKKYVMPVVLDKGEKEKVATGKESTRWSRLSKRWWQLRDYQPGTMHAIAGLSRYIACSRVTKRPVFEFIAPAIHPDNTLIVFPLADDYSFGILQSNIHWSWFIARCSTLGGTFRYTSDTVFDTFPWPQSPSLKQTRAVADTALALRKLRHDIMRDNDWSLRDLYKSLETPGENRLRDAHAALDAAVRAAYGMKPDEDILAFLLKLNLELADKESKGEPITPPGLPSFVKTLKEFISTDCVTAN